MTEQEEREKYEAANYYEIRDAEHLTHGTPEEALEDYLDGFMNVGCDAEQRIREQSEIEVTAYERKEIPADMAREWAERIASNMNEWWPEEEYGDPDADGTDGPGDKRFIEHVQPIIQAALDRTEVWQCEKVASRVYSADELVELMRKECPDWFGETTGSREAKRLRAALETIESMLGFPADQPEALMDRWSLQRTVEAAHKLVKTTLNPGEGSPDSRSGSEASEATDA